MHQPKPLIVKLGGSNFSLNDETLIDVDYLLSLKNHLKHYVEQGYKFVIVVGGGYLLRKYVKKLQAYGVENKRDLHWVGTSLNVTHAFILKAILGDLASENIIKFEDYYTAEIREFDKPIIVGGGGRPGHSGDVDSIILAEKFNAQTVISLKNVDGVYSADPKIKPDAHRLDKLNWTEYLDIIGNPDEHAPGGNYPIDPVASRMAQEKEKHFIVISGRDLDNFSKAIAGEGYLGTLVG